MVVLISFNVPNGRSNVTYSRENVGKKSKIILVLLARRELEGVEVCEGDTDVFLYNMKPCPNVRV